MGNDTPDWSGQYNTQSFYPLSDLAEVAARLGSPITFDRRGSIFWYDTFEYGLGNFSFQPDGVESALNLVTSPVYNGAFATKMLAGPANSSQAKLIRSGEIIATGKIGVAAMYKDLSNDQEITHRVDYYDGTTQYRAEMIVTRDTFVDLQVTNGAGFETLISNAEHGTLGGGYVLYKIVFDTSTKKLERVIFGVDEFDASTYTMKTVGAATDRAIIYTWMVKVLNSTGTQTCACDLVYFTGAEPPN